MPLHKLLTVEYNKKKIDCTKFISSVMISTPLFSFMTKENVQREQKKGADLSTIPNTEDGA